MLQRIQIPSGINRSSTPFAASGQWYDCNNVRFRDGVPESLGGWESLKNPPESSTEYDLEGFGRKCYSSKSYSGYKYRWVGTNRKFYISTDSGGPVDVTPNSAVETLSGTTPLATTDGSSIVTVTAATVPNVGDYVTLKDATSTGGIADTTLNRASGFIVQTVTSGPAKFTIDVEVDATSAATGGGTVKACFKVPSGSNTVVTGAGWGAGPWGGDGTPTVYELVTDESTQGAYAFLTASSLTLFVLKDGSEPTSPSPLAPGDQIYPYDMDVEDVNGISTGELNNNWWTIMNLSGVGDSSARFAPPYPPATASTLSGGGEAGKYYRYDASADGGAGAVDGATRGWGTASLEESLVVASTRRVYIDNYGEDVMYANSGGPIYYYDLSENTSTGVPIVDPENNVAEVIADDTAAFSGASGSPEVVDSFLVSKRDGHCVALGCNDIGGSTMNSLLVRWSDQNNPFDWTPSPANTSGGQVLRVGSKILGGVSTRDEVVIFTDSGVYSMKFYGPPQVFTFSLVTDGVEIASEASAVSASDAVYFMASDSFYSYTGGSVQQLDCPVAKYVFDDFNYGQREKCYGAQNSSFGEVYWFYPSSTSEEVDRYVIYSHKTGSWSYGVFDMSSFSRDIPSTTDYSRTAWRDAAVYDSPWSSYITSHTRGIENLPDAEKSGLMIHETGTSANSAPLDSHIETGDISISDGDSFTFYKRIIPDLQLFDVASTASQTQTMQIKITGRDFPGSAGNTGAVTKDIDFDISGGSASGGYPFEPTLGNTSIRGRGRSIRLKLSASATEFSWRSGDTRLDTQADGKR